MAKSEAQGGPALVWLRDDLRLTDQPALAAAVASGAPILCIYVFDEESPGLRPLGGASRWWLHHSLKALGASLEAIGGRLDILLGRAGELVPSVARAAGASCVFWTRRYEAPAIEVDSRVKAELSAEGLRVESFNGQLLFEPWTIRTKMGEFYKVFTPFWKACLALPDPGAPTPAPRKLTAAQWPSTAPKRIALDALGLLPVKPDWAEGLRAAWTPGEAGAKARLSDFLDEGIASYASNRDRPDLPATSRLSAHLRFGEITARQALAAARHAVHAGKAPVLDVEKFVAEIGWREFSYHLLFHNPDLARKNFQPRFDSFPWRTPSDAELMAWQKGLTGYPIVDAGMRELWLTGTMHNRVRMIAASFLIKDLMADWRIGEEWFWDTLCDADPASNSASWQWVAGSGADAAPYFRVFNPILQGMKFDPDGAYVRTYVPELAALPDEWIHKPWEAPPLVLRAAQVSLPRDYPMPIVDHGKARDRALAAFAEVKAATA